MSSSPVVRLVCSTQSYDWGKLGNDSKVAQLARSIPDFQVDNSKPYAEFWMGTHPNGPSRLADSNKPLKEVLNATNLTEKLHSRYHGDLPFLFKILSIRKALSIQAHPDKKLATELHTKFPDLYKDPNHKPEMAIALTPFEAFINFRPLEEICSHLESFPEFRALIGEDTTTQFMETAKSSKADLSAKKSALRALFEKLMKSSQEAITAQIGKLMSRIDSEGLKATGELYELLHRLNTQFPDDIGVFCAFLLNHVKLNPGESIFLAANEPHAYLCGDCVECMAASDNVIRSGLTPKFKDVNTLVDCLTYNHGPAETQILHGVPHKNTKHTLLYDPPIEEFSILQTKLSKGVEDKVEGVDGPSILIVTEGEGVLAHKESTDAKLGDVFFIAANVPITLTGKSEKPFIAYRAFCE
ncbi:mannose-6-phosphate isomerase [Gaertneriomyces semiglobifer]|nr:mannose-6-phosphate isomerase [Gaertneriomyces semiglobifer]